MSVPSPREPVSPELQAAVAMAAAAMRVARRNMAPTSLLFDHQVMAVRNLAHPLDEGVRSGH